MAAWLRMALKFAAVLAVLAVGGGVVLYTALDKADTASEQSDAAQDRSTSNYRRGLVFDARQRQNRELIESNRQLVMSNQRLARRNRRSFLQIKRLLVEARIAKNGRGGLRVTEAIRGATGERGGTGRTGAAGATGEAARMLGEQALQAALVPLLPAALLAICGGDCVGPQAEPVTRERLIEAARVVCIEMGCGPGPHGDPAPPPPPQRCDPSLGFVCQPAVADEPTP